MRPEWERVFCDALNFACCTPEAWERERERDSHAILACARDLACIVEDMFLQSQYSDAPVAFLDVPQDLLPVFDEPSPFVNVYLGVRIMARNGVRRLSRIADRDFSLVEDDLPAIRISSFRDPARKENASLVDCVSGVDEPLLFRGAASVAAKRAAALGSFYDYCISSLSSSGRLCQVRVSPNSNFIFCRSSHALISSGAFSPPSVTVEMRESEFAARCVKNHALPNIAYPRQYSERVYMQSALPNSACLLPRLQTISVTQQERVWFSTKGSVSALHYDASHSILIQIIGRKRMLFFPPEALPGIGVYPLGHPLHRRARVNIASDACEANRALFDSFWSSDFCADAVEVILRPGDVCTFPPGWSHYTESLDQSVSHTFRFSPKL